MNSFHICSDDAHTLMHLARACRANAEHLNRAARHTSDARLSELLQLCADQRLRFARELVMTAELTLGCHPAPAAARQGAKPTCAHWTLLETVSTCEEREKKTLRLYGRALVRRLPGDIRRLLQQQVNRIVKTCTLLDTMAGAIHVRQMLARTYATRPA